MPITPDKIYETLYNRALDTKLELEQLERTYEKKFKGEIYYTSHEVLVSRLASYQKRLENLGKEVNLVKVYGYLVKEMEGGTKIREDFTMFLTNINPDDALLVAKLTVPGYQSATATEIKLGFVITLK
jgi:hypothetical protein